MMPLRLNSITNDSRDPSLLAWILQTGTQECDSVFATPDKKYIHMKRTILDTSSQEKIGELVFTLQNTGTQLEILDMDILLLNDTPSRIHFLNLLYRSDSNEIYGISTVGEDSRLVVETVNRFTESKDLKDTERDVHISMFPFELSVYQNMDEFDRKNGFSKPIDVGKTGLLVHGFSERFCMPGGALSGNAGKDNGYSFVIGTVKSFRDVIPNFGGHKVPFVLAKVDTALGVVPVAMGRNVFDLKRLAPGCIVAMNTVVKADVAASGTFIR